MNKYIIIPDLHGTFYKFLKILKKYITIKNNKIISTKGYKIILLGDYLDKGNKEEQILLINFLYENISKLIILIGNHENKTYKKLHLKHKYCLSQNYTFFEELERNEKIKLKFLKIYKNQIRFYEDENIICTHSPCLYKHLEKKDTNLIQYKFKRKMQKEEEQIYTKYLNKFFEKILLQNNYKKIHIFGHIGIDKPIMNNNQIWLDTYEINNLNFLIIEGNQVKIINEKEEENIYKNLNIKNLKEKIVKYSLK